MNFKYLFPTPAFLLLFMLMLSSCGKDKSAPRLSITNPDDEITFVAGSDVLIEGTATDNRGLVGLSFQLTEPGNGLVLQNQENELEGPEANFSLVFNSVGDIRTEGGSYNLKITARDESGNFTSVFLPVIVEEIPRVKYATLLGVEDGQGNTELVIMDTLNNFSSKSSLGNTLSVFKMDNYNGQLLTATRFAGTFSAWSPQDNWTASWTENNQTGTGQAIFTDLSLTNNDYYLGLGISPFHKIHSPNGTLFTAWNDLINPVNALHFYNNRVYFGETSVNGQVKRITAYSATTQELLLVNNLGWDVLDILQLNANQLLVIGNDAGNGRMYVLNLNTFGITESYDLSDAVLGATLGPDYAYVLTENGVRQFDRDSYVISTIFTGGDVSIAYDAFSNHLFLGREDQLTEITLNGGLVATYSPPAGTVKFIDFHFNK